MSPARRRREGHPARRFLIGGVAVSTPAQAQTLYDHPRWRWLALALAVAVTPPGDPASVARIDAVFRDIRRVFVYRREATDVWANFTARVRRMAGRYVRLWFGDCDDFAWLMIWSLVKAGTVPRGAVLLCACTIGPGPDPDHMVAVVQTDQGSLILDNRQRRPLWADDPAFDGYRFDMIEAPAEKAGEAACWRSLRVVSLADIADSLNPPDGRS